ncbi:MAG: peroxiredoxin [Burkholderiaceae bacterium]
MKHFSLTSILFAALLLSTISLPTYAALKEGDAAPDFNTQASLAGKSFTFSLRNALAKGTVVVYFYPSAYTSGCNIQAHEFAVNYDKFTAAHAAIIGVSLDSIARLDSFSVDPNYCAGKIPVASDTDGKIAKSYDLTVRNMPSWISTWIKDTRGIAIDHGFAERTTFIVTPDGKIAATIGGLEPKTNVEKSLEIVQKLDVARHANKP